ncbi:MAG: hypothetical protein NVS3B25_25160 [Hymenobacter sp.]
MNETTTSTMPQLDWLLTTPVASYEYLVFAKREGIAFPASVNEPKHITGMRQSVVQPIECVDGTTISVQAGRTMYCQPRQDSGPWDEVEVGYPSVDPGAEMRQFQDGEGDPTQSVFGYVPVELVRAFIEAHGGEKR